MTPTSNTIEERMINVGSGHKIYAQLWGNPDADKTILHFHGGPGSGTSNRHVNMFNPDTQKVLFFDQRGSGNSAYQSLLRDNDSDHLIDDVVKIAAEFGIDSFVVYGTSWGCFLAMVLAIRYPRLVDSIITQGVFTGTKSEIDFMEKGEARVFFPDVWERYVATVPSEFAENPSDYHWPRILGDNETAAKKSAYNSESYEFQLLELDDRKQEIDFEDFDPTGAKIFAHIMSNSCGVEEEYIFNNAPQIECPVYIVQGRYDMVCPPRTAYRLHSLLPNSYLHWTVSGHRSGDRGNYDALRPFISLLG